MITWMVTRLGFALLWPRSPLPTIEQPLSGELAFSRRRRRLIAADPRVKSQSDWGVDTAITFRDPCAWSFGLRVLHRPRQGPRPLFVVGRHQGHDGRVPRGPSEVASHRGTATFSTPVERMSEPRDSVSEQIAQQIGFDIEATQRLSGRWIGTRDRKPCSLPIFRRTSRSRRGVERWPDTSWMDEETWLATLAILLDRLRARRRRLGRPRLSSVGRSGSPLHASHRGQRSRVRGRLSPCNGRAGDRCCDSIRPDISSIRAACGLCFMLLSICFS